MKPVFKRLDYIDLHVSSRMPTENERKEMSAFIEELKRKANVKA